MSHAQLEDLQLIAGAGWNLFMKEELFLLWCGVEKDVDANEDNNGYLREGFKKVTSGVAEIEQLTGLQITHVNCHGDYKVSFDQRWPHMDPMVIKLRQIAYMCEVVEDIDLMMSSLVNKYFGSVTS